MEHVVVTKQKHASGRALRVLIVVPSKLGGTVQYSHNLANALADLGHKVLLATSLDYEMNRFDRRYETVEVFDRFRPHLGPIRAFLKKVSDLQPDIIHFQGAQRPEFYLLLQALLARMTSAKFVWTPQDVLSNSQKVWHVRMLRRIYARMSYVFLNANQNCDAVTELFHVPAERIQVLPIPEYLSFVREELGSELPADLSLDMDRPLVLCFGLIEKRKGIDTLLEAFSLVRKKNVSARLLVMGSSLMDIKPHKEAIENLGLAGDVQIIDRYASFEEMNALFGTAHHVVMAYHQGWNSGVLTTAFGYGKPVIASAVGGFDELVSDGVSGLLVPPKDPGALAGAIEQMLSDPTAYAQMCEGALQASLVSSWPELAGKTEDAYQRALAPTA